MTAGLDFEVVPESCLRNDQIQLMLGMPINQVIVALQNVSRIIKNVEFVYDNKCPFQRDITITLVNEGIRLYFEPNLQILKLIEVFDFKNISLHYCNNTFSTPSEAANVSKVENCFGATHPGVYDEGQRIYLLHWRGVSFAFPAKEPASTVQPSYAHGLGSLKFANSSLPLLERMTVYCGSSQNEIKIPEVPVSVHCGNVLLQHIESLNENGEITGLKVVFRSEANSVTAPRKTSDMERVERLIRFGDTEQDVLCALGAASKIYYKSDEKMLIQRGTNSQNLRDIDKPDFFFNYFPLGLDILFDYESRRVLKFVLHTNIPGHFDFGIYTRCNFTIGVDRHCGGGKGKVAVAADPIVLTTNSKLEDFSALFIEEQQQHQPHHQQHQQSRIPRAVNNNSDGSRKSSGTSTASGASALGGAPPICARPVVLNKCSSMAAASGGDGGVGSVSGGGGIAAAECENPFGATFCYGTRQLIVEVTDNSHIASLILYK